ncbi:ketohexokinase [Karstenula rhodostoma CBS 690.94]|uniref:Ketohexokinase n=1 Tax=Karstenula rhodostoma CBS 690.94 TaxID=1392251 RepID=A0A9P4P9C4_9PLEO|nr:ketohexokinase [Karstenula rhodostoma CBS 690.94]
MSTGFVCIGAVYIDTILSVPKFPNEDEKLRATGHTRRRGGNCTNTLEVLSQLVARGEQTKGEPRAQLYLLSVLPERPSADIRFISQSIPKVNIDTGCIFREGFENAASSYIIQAAANNSRTIVSHNPLPEMTTQEFIDGASAIWKQSEVKQHWFHFEGRIPVVTEASVRWLTDKFPSAKISVECEKPERDYMVHVAREADVVFFSKIWAEAQSYNDPWTFLGAQIKDMKPGAILVCTWGSAGATCVRNNTHQAEDHEWASTTAWKPATGPLDVIETIGAGDTFIAGFLYALNREGEWTLQQKLEFANELAGRKVSQVGFGGLSEQMRLA